MVECSFVSRDCITSALSLLVPARKYDYAENKIRKRGGRILTKRKFLNLQIN